jgi:hypothetical protein
LKRQERIKDNAEITEDAEIAEKRDDNTEFTEGRTQRAQRREEKRREEEPKTQAPAYGGPRATGREKRRSERV